MKMKNYEKPSMEFVTLRNKEAVANKCWGYHGTSTKLYCDLPGKGYCSFQIGAGSCTLNMVSVTYYDGDGNSRSATSAEISTLDGLLRGAGGESGNPFKGEGTTVIPGQPGNWS